MQLHAFFIIAFALSVTGCAEKEQPAAEQGDDTQITDIAAESTAVEAPTTVPEFSPDQAFLDHMHAHAEHLDDLNYALADDDLEAAMTPAYWLSRHDEVSGVPSDWQPYVNGMREAARAVEAAADLGAARVAAERIAEQCQGCHAAAGVTHLNR